MLSFLLLIKPQDEDDDISLGIRKSIIPAIAYLSAHTPNMSLGDVLGEDLTGSRLSSLNLGTTILCSDLRESDIFFDSFKKK